jgi:hypothetical protein
VCIQCHSSTVCNRPLCRIDIGPTLKLSAARMDQDIGVPTVGMRTGDIIEAGVTKRLPVILKMLLSQMTRQARRWWRAAPT